jgi:hypothetical protein
MSVTWTVSFVTFRYASHRAFAFNKRKLVQNNFSYFAAKHFSNYSLFQSSIRYSVATKIS